MFDGDAIVCGSEYGSGYGSEYNDGIDYKYNDGIDYGI